MRVSSDRMSCTLPSEVNPVVFPIGDDNSDIRRTPIVNYVLIALNVFVFVVFQGAGENHRFTYAFSTVPAEIRTGKDIVTDDTVIVDRRTGEQFSAPGLQPTPWSVYLTLLTSMFMHGGIAHLLGNLWFLWIFGDNVEDRMGRGRTHELSTSTAISRSNIFRHDPRRWIAPAQTSNR
jgi:membrane associated rhomboid family serine protease